jgi:hypothetical protein
MGITSKCSMDPHTRRLDPVKLRRVIPQLTRVRSMLPFLAFRGTRLATARDFRRGGPNTKIRRQSGTTSETSGMPSIRPDLNVGTKKAMRKPWFWILCCAVNADSPRHIAYSADAHSVLTCCFGVELRLSIPRLANGSHADHVSSTHICYRTRQQ